MTCAGQAPRLEVEAASKTFGTIKALDDVRLSVLPGEIHGLIGENGSGKSTLVKILTGYHAPDPGVSIRVDGSALGTPIRWTEALAAGIAVVHQDLGLLDQLTVAENIGVGSYRRSRWLRHIDWKHEADVAEQTLQRLDAAYPPKTLVGDLPAAARAEVAIARALRHHQAGSGLIILDEATRLLAGDDLARFHRVLRRIADDGTAVLMVSHNLEEVLAVTDRVTVLRDGAVAGEGLVTGEVDEQELARRMLGKTASGLGQRQSYRTDQVAVTVTGLRTSTHEVGDITINAGEIVGLTGLPGTGFERIPYLLSGAETATRGVMRVGSRELDLRRTDIATAIRSGIVLVPERRDRDGLALELSVRDNITLPSLAALGSPLFLSRRKETGVAEQTVSDLGVRAHSVQQLVRQLSGGNQQKVLLGKWLSLEPRLLILHEPTQAVDVGARIDLLRSIRAAAARGAAVLLVSIHAEDLVAVCDRVVVQGPDGGLSELVTDDVDRILEAVYGTASVS